VNARHAALRGAGLQTLLLEDLRHALGVEAASIAASPIGQTGWDGSVYVEGYAPSLNRDDSAHFNSVSADYFKSLRTPMILGREFDERDTETSPRVAIVNETFVRRYFADRQPLGKWVNTAGNQPRYKMVVVGVAKDVQAPTLRDGVPPMMFMSIVQGGGAGGPPDGGYLVRGSLTGAVLDTILKRIDPKLRAEELRTLEEQLSRTMLRE